MFTFPSRSFNKEFRVNQVHLSTLLDPFHTARYSDYIPPGCSDCSQTAFSQAALMRNSVAIFINRYKVSFLQPPYPLSLLGLALAKLLAPV